MHTCAWACVCMSTWHLTNKNTHGIQLIPFIYALSIFAQIAEYSFAYGVQYAWNVVMFAMVMTYSLTAPLIVPAGMAVHVPCTL